MTIACTATMLFSLVGVYGGLTCTLLYLWNKKQSTCNDEEKEL